MTLTNAQTATLKRLGFRWAVGIDAYWLPMDKVHRIHDVLVRLAADQFDQRKVYISDEGIKVQP